MGKREFLNNESKYSITFFQTGNTSSCVSECSAELLGLLGGNSFSFSIIDNALVVAFSNRKNSVSTKNRLGCDRIKLVEILSNYKSNSSVRNFLNELIDNDYNLKPCSGLAVSIGLFYDKDLNVAYTSLDNKKILAETKHKMIHFKIKAKNNSNCTSYYAIKRSNGYLSVCKGIKDKLEHSRVEIGTQFEKLILKDSAGGYAIHHSVKDAQALFSARDGVYTFNEQKKGLFVGSLVDIY